MKLAVQNLSKQYRGGVLSLQDFNLALGIWSGPRRLFELVYLLWWYFIFNGAQAQDFMGTTVSALENWLPGV